MGQEAFCQKHGLHRTRHLLWQCRGLGLAPFLVAVACGALAQTSPPSVVQTLDVAPAWGGHSVGYCLLTKGEHQYVAYYDHERRMTIAMRRLTSSNWTFRRLPQRVNWDSHHYITMAMDRAGCLHVSGNMHSDPLVYFRTEEPYDLATLRRERAMVGEQESQCTYPQFLFNGEGDLFFLYRFGKSGENEATKHKFRLKLLENSSV